MPIEGVILREDFMNQVLSAFLCPDGYPRVVDVDLMACVSISANAGQSRRALFVRACAQLFVYLTYMLFITPEALDCINYS